SAGAGDAAGVRERRRGGVSGPWTSGAAPPPAFAAGHLLTTPSTPMGHTSRWMASGVRPSRDGLTPDAIRRLVCPIGVEGVVSKWPAAIAVGVAAQLLQGLETPPGARSGKLAVCPTPADPAETCPPSGCAA